MERNHEENNLEKIMRHKESGVQVQRDYYARTAQSYESMHFHEREHDLSCALIHSLSQFHGFTSILDIGSGTGRGIRNLAEMLPKVRVVGMEPVEALRSIGHANGIPEHQLIDGDATDMNFPDSSFDLVSELSVLHHIGDSRRAVVEMLRVAKRGIFISDVNRFGHGSVAARLSKLLLWKLHLWPTANWFKTKGRGYIYTEGDGVSYSYSVFDDYDFIASQCEKVMVFNLVGTGKNPVTGASHVGLFGLKKQ